MVRGSSILRRTRRGRPLAPALAALCFVLAAAGPAGAREGYPRVLNFFLSNSVTPEQIADLAQWDALVLDGDFEFENPGAIATIRSLNPAIRIFGYIAINGTGEDAYLRPPESVLHQHYVGIEDGDFWLYSVDGTRVSDWPGKWSSNLTPNSPVNSLGETYDEWFARFVYEVLWQEGNGPWDGICLDDVWDDISWLNNLVSSPIDSDRNGVADDPAQLDAWWKAGNAILVDRLRQLVGPDVPIIGNGHNTIYGDLNGTMIESFPWNGAADQNNPYGYAWNKWMFTYQGSYFTAQENFLAQPYQVMIINTRWSAGTPWEPDRSGRFEAHKRLCLGSALLGDGYFSFDFTMDEHAAIWWEPEYDRYIGTPVGPAYSYVLGGKTIWRRDYTDATVVVNPNNIALLPEAGIPAIDGWDAYIGDRIYDPPPQDLTPPAEINKYWGWANGPTSATLKFWSVGDDGMAGRADHYLVRYATIGINSLAVWDAATPAICNLVPKWPGIPETLIVEGLDPETTYYFAVRAVDDEGFESPIGTYYFRIVTLPPEPPGGDVTPPQAITTLSKQTLTPGSITYQWGAPGDDGNQGVAALYHGRYANVPITLANWASTTPVPDLPTPSGAGTAEIATLGGLAPATTYYLTLRAEDDAGNLGALGNVLAFTTIEAPDTTGPAPVTDLHVVSTTTTQVSLGFTAPADDVNSVAFYLLRYVVGSSFPESAWEGATAVPAGGAQPPGTAVVVAATDLAPGTTYAWRMRARDDRGNEGGLSNVTVATTATTSADNLPPRTVDDLVITSNGDDWLSLGFTAPLDDGGGTVAGYEIRYVSGATFPEAMWGTATPVTSPAPGGPGTPQAITASGLAPGATYCFRLRSVDGSGNVSGLGNEASGTTSVPPPPPDDQPPALVADLRATGVGVSFVALAFTAPADLGGGTVASYEVRRVAGASFPDAAWGGATLAAAPAVLAPGQPVAFYAASLAAGTTWSFRVRATDDSGNTNAPGNVVTATTTPPPPPDTTPPDPVDDLAVVAADTTRLDLAFTTPADVGGGVVSFDLRWVVGTSFPEAAWAAATVAGAPYPGPEGTAHAVTVSGLAPGTAYSFRIRAVDGAGNGSALGAAATGTTTTPPPPPARSARPRDGHRPSGRGRGRDVARPPLHRSGRRGGPGGVVRSAVRGRQRVPRLPVDDRARRAGSGAAGAGRDRDDPRDRPRFGRRVHVPHPVDRRRRQPERARQRRRRHDGVRSAPAPSPPPADTIPPAPVTDLVATFLDSTAVLVTWTATGDDGGSGEAHQYDLRWRPDAIDAGTWNAATAVNDLPDPRPAGSDEAMIVTGLPAPAVLAFAIVVADEAGNVSAPGFAAPVALPDPVPPPPPDTQPPGPVGGLEGLAGEGGVVITWRPALEADLSHYRVYRSRSAGGTIALYRDRVAFPTFADERVVPGRRYCYQVAAVDETGNEGARSATIEVDVPMTLRVQLPGETFGVGLPSPNPSMGPVEIPIATGRQRAVVVEVYDVSGRLVHREAAEAVGAGEGVLRWDGRDTGGRAVGRGIYWIRVRSESDEAVRRVLVAR